MEFAVDARRRIYTRADLREGIPAGYRWWLHAGFLGAQAMGLAIVSALELSAVTVGEWLLFVASLVLMNLGEYLVHRYPFHRRLLPGGIYRRHTVQHHSFFTHQTMGIDAVKDLKLVMLPAAGLLGVVLALSPILTLLVVFGSPNAPWLFLLALGLCYGSYEVFHTLAHLPEDAPVARSPIVRAICHHHRVHHDPARMRHYNFNFAFPLGDWLFGTRAPPD